MVIKLVVKDLRRHVQWRPAIEPYHLILLKNSRESEVSELRLDATAVF
jgi:hypothetical protein